MRFASWLRYNVRVRRGFRFRVTAPPSTDIFLIRYSPLAQAIATKESGWNA